MNQARTVTAKFARGTTTSLSASVGTRHIHSTPALGDWTQRSCLALANSSAVSCP